jgi:predicted O-methyltransferase YrrM
MTGPAVLERIEVETRELGFGMGSDPGVGSLLASLAASKPAGAILEIGTGTGLGAAWILSGMDARSTLTTVESDEAVVAVARRWLGTDPRIEFVVGDGGVFLERADPERYDLIFADSWPGKFSHLDEALRALRVGGVYVIDDLLPQPNWPEDHPPKVERLVAELMQRADLVITRLAWSTGVIIATKRVRER